MIARPTLKSSEYTRQYQRFLQSPKQARKEAGLTQQEVSQMLSRPQSFVSKCESGERRVDFVELQFFAKVYGKPLSIFQVSNEY